MNFSNDRLPEHVWTTAGRRLTDHEVLDMEEHARRVARGDPVPCGCDLHCPKRGPRDPHEYDVAGDGSGAVSSCVFCGRAR